MALPRRRLERAIDETFRQRLCRPEELDAMLAAHPGQPGAGALADVLATHAPATLTRSALEERFLALGRAHGLPQPAANASVLDLTVDFRA